MSIGQKVKITIPPWMAYGAYGDGGKIPPNSTLVFIIELFSFKDEEQVDYDQMRAKFENESRSK